MPAQVQTWLLTRLPRHAAAVQEAVARLDHAALARGRGITRALAAQVIADIAAMAGANTDGEDEIFTSSSPPPTMLL